MKIRPLVMDDEARNKIKGLQATATENPYDFARVKRLCEGLEQPVGDHYAIELDFGYRVVYSIEQQPLKDGSGFAWMDHLSISVSCDNGVWPSPEACNWILSEFGMPVMDSMQCTIWLENEKDSTMPSAVNFVSERESKSRIPEASVN